MATFDEFYRSLPEDSNKRGEYFEKVFIPWFLRTDPEWSTKVRKIWLWEEYPSRPSAITATPQSSTSRTTTSITTQNEQLGCWRLAREKELKIAKQAKQTLANGCLERKVDHAGNALQCTNEPTQPSCLV